MLQRWDGVLLVFAGEAADKSAGPRAKLGAMLPFAKLAQLLRWGIFLPDASCLCWRFTSVITAA